MKNVFLAVALGAFGAASNAVPLTFTNEGIDGLTTVFRATLGGLGLTQVGSVSILDSNSGTGGSPGVFSGFDLDFVFIDLDGLYATSGDRVFGSAFAFTTGAIRPSGGDPNFEPTVARPGPTFGSSAANAIDPGLSTLDIRDGDFSSGVSTDLVFGWLTLGDGGSLGVGFGPPVVLTGSEALFLGEVGTGAGELVDASITVRQTGLPEPATAALVVLGLAGIGRACKKRPA